MAAWPYSVCMLCKFTMFWGTVDSPAGAVDMAHFGVLFLRSRSFFWAMGWTPVAQVKRLFGLGIAHTAAFPFLLCLFQKESKLGRDVSLSAAWSGRWASFLVGLVGSYLVGLVLTCPGCVIRGGNTALMGFRPGRLKVVIINASRRSVGFRLS